MKRGGSLGKSDSSAFVTASANSFSSNWSHPLNMKTPSDLRTRLASRPYRRRVDKAHCRFQKIEVTRAASQPIAEIVPSATVARDLLRYQPRRRASCQQPLAQMSSERAQLRVLDGF